MKTILKVITCSATIIVFLSSCGTSTTEKKEVDLSPPSYATKKVESRNIINEESKTNIIPKYKVGDVLVTPTHGNTRNIHIYPSYPIFVNGGGPEGTHCEVGNNIEMKILEVFNVYKDYKSTIDLINKRAEESKTQYGYEINRRPFANYIWYLVETSEASFKCFNNNTNINKGYISEEENSMLLKK